MIEEEDGKNSVPSTDSPIRESNGNLCDNRIAVRVGDNSAEDEDHAMEHLVGGNEHDSFLFAGLAERLFLDLSKVVDDALVKGVNSVPSATSLFPNEQSRTAPRRRLSSQGASPVGGNNHSALLQQLRATYQQHVKIMKAYALQQLFSLPSASFNRSQRQYILHQLRQDDEARENAVSVIPGLGALSERINLNRAEAQTKGNLTETASTALPPPLQAVPPAADETVEDTEAKLRHLADRLNEAKRQKCLLETKLAAKIHYLETVALVTTSLDRSWEVDAVLVENEALSRLVDRRNQLERDCNDSLVVLATLQQEHPSEQDYAIDDEDTRELQLALNHHQQQRLRPHALQEILALHQWRPRQCHLTSIQSLNDVLRQNQPRRGNQTRGEAN